MTLKFLVGGMPRSGTTVAAKFMSLHHDMFCYAGETHLIPFMHSLFGQLPCREDKIDLVTQFLRQQFMTAMIEMPKFSISKGAHPGNNIFDEKDVDDLIEIVRCHLKAQLCGAQLYKASLTTLNGLLSRKDPRNILGEKTPSNIFAMADYAEMNTVTKNIVVMREPIGVLRSMKARGVVGDAYSSAFKGTLESNIGMYLEYAMAAQQVLSPSEGGFLVRYEDIAQMPATVVKEMFNLFERRAEERVTHFVEGNWDAEIANRAPMNYKRLCVTAGNADLSPEDVWKVFNLTRKLRESFGYSDVAMNDLGFEVPTEWPGAEVPSKILPLYGFHKPGLIGSLWMKRRGGLVAYLGKRRSHNITLKLKSKFPDQIQGEVELRVSINGIPRKVLKVNTGNQSIVVNMEIHPDELNPMGNDGGYTIIDLVSSLAYSQLGHTANGDDAREISFQLCNWQINRRHSKWWWR